MTDQQHHLVLQMYKPGRYLMRKSSRTDRDGYMLYKGRQDPVQWFSDKTVRIVRDILKMDKQKKFTLNLNLVRQMHGKSLLKKIYKSQKKCLPNLS